ncbi:MAG: anthranilate synthase component I [Chthoniobacterales bacterium]|nr:anthranilate synthase component I [Chthoniobacterales bacterium]
MAEPALTPTPAEFEQLARKGNVIPLYAELIADSETPVSAFQKIDDGRHCFLFESAETNEQSGRFSFIGFDPQLTFESRGRSITVTRNGETRSFETTTDPLRELEATMAQFRFAALPELRHFSGGAVGFIGYDVVRFFEPSVPATGPDELHSPEMMFMVARVLIVFDHRFRRVRIIANVFLDENAPAAEAYAAAGARIEETIAKLARPAPLPLLTTDRSAAGAEPRSNTTPEEFHRMVAAVQERIAAGDIFQAVLSQRFAADFGGTPLALYRALRFINSSPYMFCLQTDRDFAVVGSSPELQVRASQGRLEIRPIAGTRPRGLTPEEDERHATNLMADPKELAEHVMLIDLGRNDLGRVAEFGSVRVTEQMVIERYSHVMHIVSHVEAQLRPDQTVFDVMRATFPAGTVSGAPKVRAMQIIAELEKSKRGFYAGAVGYFGFDGNLDSCIALRSVVLQGGQAYVQAGAGIVADSDPASEYRETVNKAKAALEAIARATANAE